MTTQTTGSDIWEVDLALHIGRDPRAGCVAQWSLAAIFVVPGLLDGSVPLIVLGAMLAVCAMVGTFRALTRATTPFGASARPPDDASRPRNGWVKPDRDAASCRSTPRSRRRPCARGLR